MKDIYVQDCTIQGVAQNVIKALYYSMKNIEGKTSAAVWKQKTISFLINSTYQKERRTYKENLYLFENSGILSQPYLVLYDK